MAWTYLTWAYVAVGMAAAVAGLYCVFFSVPAVGVLLTYLAMICAGAALACNSRAA